MIKDLSLEELNLQLGKHLWLMPTNDNLTVVPRNFFIENNTKLIVGFEAPGGVFNGLDSIHTTANINFSVVDIAPIKFFKRIILPIDMDIEVAKVALRCAYDQFCDELFEDGKFYVSCTKGGVSQDHPDFEGKYIRVIENDLGYEARFYTHFAEVDEETFNKVKKLV